MAQTPEGKVKARAKKIYEARGAKYDRAAATGMGTNGRPDDLVRRRPDGHFLGVEAKKEAVFDVTLLQKIWLEDCADGGGSSMVVNMTNLDLLDKVLATPGCRIVAAFEDLEKGARCTGHTVYLGDQSKWIPAKPEK